MGLQGDLATLDLTGLLQNLETARNTGVLTVEDGRDVARLCFREGRLAAVAYADRPSVAEYLVAAGVVDADRLQRARKGRRKKGTLGKHLVDAELLDPERLVGLVTSRITDEACDLLTTGAGRFEFVDGDAPADWFDDDELALGIALPAGPLLLEAARRADHWRVIRERIPSDSMHYELARRPGAAATAAAAKLVKELVPLLDGTRSVGEIATRFPHRRFEVYELLAQLAAAQTIRPCDPADVAKRVVDLARRDEGRAWELLARGLDHDPRNQSLLTTKAHLAERRGEREQACEALKMVAHLELERGGREAARTVLERLKTLDADDPFAWERSFELALEEGRGEDAVADGKRLVELYRGPGLAKKAAAVIERLLDVGRPTWDLVHELVQLRVDAHDVRGAVEVLDRYGSARLAEEAYPLAQRAYDEVLLLEPRNKRAKQVLVEIASGALVQRRARMRRRRRLGVLAAVCFVLAPWLIYESVARAAYGEATRRMLDERWLEDARYDDAIAAFRYVRESYPWSTASLFEASGTLAALEAKRAAVGSQSPR
jgi:tetratricopeptide (TPR) repeat protein